MTDQNKSREYFRDLLEHRSKRLGKLIKMSAPGNLIGQEVILVMQAAMGYCPEEVSHSMQKWLSGEVRVSASFCKNCDEKPVANGRCVTCEEARIEEEQALDTYIVEPDSET